MDKPLKKKITIAQGNIIHGTSTVQLPKQDLTKDNTKAC